MKQVFVNSIHEERNLTFGIAVLNHTVEEDLRIMFDKNYLLAIMELAKRNKSNGGMNVFVAYCQFVAFIHVKVEPFDGVIRFIDCKGNSDAALDEYLLFQENGWDKIGRDGFMKEFQKISQNPPVELAEMIIKDPFP